MSRVIFQSKVEKVIDHTKCVRELVIRWSEPAEMNFKAGQFVMLHVPDSSTGKPALRAYSIASSDQDKNFVRLLLRYVEGGKASQYVWNLKGGEDLQFTGPFGRVFFQEPVAERVIMLSTGTGLAQHLSYLYSKAELFPNTEFKLMVGVRYFEDIYLKAELDFLTKNLPHFSYDYVLSKPPVDWAGLKGHVQHHLGLLQPTFKPTQFYLCGNGHMIKDTKTLLFDNYGINKADVHVEAFD